jgi:hypothetical protein
MTVFGFLRRVTLSRSPKFPRNVWSCSCMYKYSVILSECGVPLYQLAQLLSLFWLLSPSRTYLPNYLPTHPNDQNQVPVVQPLCTRTDWLLGFQYVLHCNIAVNASDWSELWFSVSTQSHRKTSRWSAELGAEKLLCSGTPLATCGAFPRILSSYRRGTRVQAKSSRLCPVWARHLSSSTAMSCAEHTGAYEWKLSRCWLDVSVINSA